MKSIKSFLLILASISFITIIGGAIYEHVAVIPQWKLAPPVSLAMFQGEYGLNPAPFWQMIHPITLALLIAALVANWKTARRKFILFPLGGYVLVLIITFMYFVPELLSIVQTPYQTTVDQNLVSRAGKWETLSLVRLVFIVILAIGLLLGLTEQNDQENKAM